MRTEWKRGIGLWAGRVLAVVLGTLAGFFFVFNSIFSDVFALGERLFSFALIFVVYTILGMSFGGVSPKQSTHWFWLLDTPGLIMVVLYTLGEPNIPLHALVLLVMFFGTYVGLAAGKAMRR